MYIYIYEIFKVFNHKLNFCCVSIKKQYRNEKKYNDFTLLIVLDKVDCDFKLEHVVNSKFRGKTKNMILLYEC